MGICHIFHTIGDDIAGRQRIKHSVVSHGNPVVYGNGIEFGSKATAFFDHGFHILPDFMQVYMSRYELGE